MMPDRDFFLCDAVTLAQKLLGLELVHRLDGEETGGIIVEVEAYCGKEDPAAHSYKAGPEGRTAAMYGMGGHAYIYLIYGMYHCFNVVAHGVGTPHGVLLRALAPKTGIPMMTQRRGGAPLSKLCSGPGRLTQAMGITGAQYGWDLLGDKLFLRPGDMPAFEVVASPRINVDYAGQAALYPWRFTVKDSPFVSKKP